MYTFPSRSCAVLCASLLLATSSFVAGCAGSATSATNPAAAINVSGNWQFTAAAGSAPLLPALSGDFTGNGASFTGHLHALAATACTTPATVVAVSGQADAHNAVTLTGPNFQGGTLTITGTLSADGKSFANASYNVTGGACAFAAPAVNVTAHAFQPISGNYTGTFSDPDGNVISIAASLSQSPASDANGNFSLSGTATFPANPCFNSPVSVSNTQVTGGSFTQTYADSSTGNSVTASGTFSQDGQTLTVTNWTLSGSCGPDYGTGTMTHQ